jgi:hypothetical protein
MYGGGQGSLTTSRSPSKTTLIIKTLFFLFIPDVIYIIIVIVFFFGRFRESRKKGGHWLLLGKHSLHNNTRLQTADLHEKLHVYCRSCLFRVTFARFSRYLFIMLLTVTDPVIAYLLLLHIYTIILDIYS